MSTAIASSGLRISIADPIKQKADLAAAVVSASKRYEELLLKYDLYDAERELELMWASDGPDGPHDNIAIVAIEQDEYGQRIAQRFITPKHILDPVARNAAVSDVYMDILGKRLEQANTRIKARLRELDNPEVNNGNSR